MNRPATSIVSPPLDRDELAAILAMLHAAAARVEAILDEKPAVQRWLSTSEAANAACIGSQQTVRNWCKRYTIGIKVRNVWQVDSVLLEQFLADRRN